MNNDKRLGRPRLIIEYLLLGLLGVLLIAIAIITQWPSPGDFGRFSLEYAMAFVRTWVWWTIVGIPLLSGVGYLIAAFIGSTFALDGSRALVLFGGSLLFALILCPIIGGVAYLATVHTTLLMLQVVLRIRRSAHVQLR